MNKQLLSVGALVALLAALPAVAKLPPLSDEAKAKAAEAAAKTAHGNKVADFQLCKRMDAVAADYYAKAKKAGKAVPPAEKTVPCADPGALVYVPSPPPAAPGAAPAAPTAVAAATAPATAAAPKK